MAGHFGSLGHPHCPRGLRGPPMTWLADDPCRPCRPLPRHRERPDIGKRASWPACLVTRGGCLQLRAPIGALQTCKHPVRLTCKQAASTCKRPASTCKRCNHRSCKRAASTRAKWLMFAALRTGRICRLGRSPDRRRSQSIRLPPSANARRESRPVSLVSRHHRRRLEHRRGRAGCIRAPNRPWWWCLAL